MYDRLKYEDLVMIEKDQSMLHSPDCRLCASLDPIVLTS